MNSNEHHHSKEDNLASEMMEICRTARAVDIEFVDATREVRHVLLNLVLDTNNLAEPNPLISNFKFDLGIANSPQVSIVGTLNEGLGGIYEQYTRCIAKRPLFDFELPVLINPRSGEVVDGVKKSGNFIPDVVKKRAPLLLVAYDYSTIRYGEVVIRPLGFRSPPGSRGV